MLFYMSNIANTKTSTTQEFTAGLGDFLLHIFSLVLLNKGDIAIMERINLYTTLIYSSLFSRFNYLNNT